MKLQSAVIEAGSRPDYALAVAAASRIASKRGLAHCYPVLAADRSRAGFARVLDAYGLVRLRLEDLFPANSVTERARQMRKALFPTSLRPVVIPADAHGDDIAAAVWLCLSESRPLEFGANEDALTDPEPGQSGHVLWVRSGCRHAVAAAFYAHAAGKQFGFVRDWQPALDSAPDSAHSYLLVDDYATFQKSFLARALESPRLRSAPQGAGILTAFNDAEFTRLLVRILLDRDVLEPPPNLVRYRVVTEHGNEMHMELESGEFLCGAVQEDEDDGQELAFDCRPTCPHANRIPAGSVPVQHLLISSCNTFTLGDGIVGPQFSLLFRMLSGWCCSVMAPFKHALSGPAIPLLTDALARSGFSLGASTERLNSIAPYGARPDPAYVLFGDPETVIMAPAGEPHKPSATVIGDSLAVAGELNGRCAAEWSLPEASLDAVARKNGGQLALVPLCDSLRSPDVYFAFRQEPAAGSWSLVLFSGRELPRTRAQLALTGAAGISPQLHARALEAIRALYQLQAVGIPIGQIQHAEENIISQLRFGAGYPRLVEFAIGETVIRNMAAILDAQFTEARHEVLRQLVELTADRLWISQSYGRHYSSVRREPSGSVPCPYCACETTQWRFDDDCTGRPARTLVICARCGIIADHPTERELAVRIEKVGELPLDGVTVGVSVTNRAERTLKASVAAQFHEWRGLGVSADAGLFTFELAPGETLTRDFVFNFSKPFGDYMQDIHVFTLTEDFALSCFTQKMTSAHSSLRRKTLVSTGAVGRTN